MDGKIYRLSHCMLCKDHDTLGVVTGGDFEAVGTSLRHSNLSSGAIGWGSGTVGDK